MPAVPPLTVAPLAPALEPAWDAFLRSRERALFYASLPYRDLLARVLGARPHYLVALDGDSVCGLLPCFAASHSAWGTVLNSLPYYGSNGGFITDGRPEVARALAAAFVELDRGLGCSSSTVITSPFDVDLSVFEQGLEPSFVDDRIGQVTPLPTDATEEVLFALYDDTARRNVRKARKSGVEWRVDDSADAIAFLHRAHDENIRAIGGLPKSRDFFEAIPHSIPQRHWRVYVAELNGEPAAALLVFRFNRTVEYFTPAIVEAYRPMQALALLVHEAMREATADGYRWWNWGGTWKTQLGVYRFKRKWGALDLPYHYYTRLHRPEILRCSRAELLAAFPGFFVVPFDKLETTQHSSIQPVVSR